MYIQVGLIRGHAKDTAWIAKQASHTRPTDANDRTASSTATNTPITSDRSAKSNDRAATNNNNMDERARTFASSHRNEESDSRNSIFKNIDTAEETTSRPPTSRPPPPGVSKLHLPLDKLKFDNNTLEGSDSRRNSHLQNLSSFSGVSSGKDTGLPSSRRDSAAPSPRTPRHVATASVAAAVFGSAYGVPAESNGAGGVNIEQLALNERGKLPVEKSGNAEAEAEAGAKDKVLYTFLCVRACVHSVSERSIEAEGQGIAYVCAGARMFFCILCVCFLVFYFMCMCVRVCAPTELGNLLAEKGGGCEEC
jgi:hypothetical protein